jgi:hypothetical protein
MKCSDPFHIKCKRETTPGINLRGSPHHPVAAPCQKCRWEMRQPRPKRRLALPNITDPDVP